MPLLIEEQRFLHEDLERLEQAISDRTSENPKTVRLKILPESSMWLTRR